MVKCNKYTCVLYIQAFNLYVYIEILRRAWPLLIYVTKGKRFNKIVLCCLKENIIGQYNTNVNSTQLNILI